MPRRTTIGEGQRALFSELSKITDLVLTLKNDGPDGNADLASVNIHGKVQIFPKHWRGFDDPDEDLLFSAANSHVTSTGEPSVHLHVDWQQVNFVVVRRRELKLIGMDAEIALLKSPHPNEVRVFWFYAHYDSLSELLERYSLGQAVPLS